MYVRDYELEMMIFPEFKLHKNLLLYIAPIIIVTGTVGNTLSFIVLTQQGMRNFSAYFYFSVLAVADTLVLYIGLLRLWVGELTGYDIKDQYGWSCKTINVLGYTVSDYSVWIIISVTVERYIITCHPFKAARLCTFRKAVKVVIGLFVLLFLINSHFFWTVRLIDFEHKGLYVSQCAGGDPFRVLVEDVWPWVDTFLYSFIPFAVILMLNSLIIHEVLKARRARDELQGDSVTMCSHGNHSGRHRSQNESSRLTVMLLTISFTFLLTTLPNNICLIASTTWVKSTKDLQQFARYRLAKTFTELLMYTNHSMNFFLYCATGNKFRQQLMTLFCKKKFHGVTRQGSEHSHSNHLTMPNLDSKKNMDGTTFIALVTDENGEQKTLPGTDV